MEGANGLVQRLSIVSMHARPPLPPGEKRQLIDPWLLVSLMHTQKGSLDLCGLIFFYLVFIAGSVFFFFSVLSYSFLTHFPILFLTNCLFLCIYFVLSLGTCTERILRRVYVFYFHVFKFSFLLIYIFSQGYPPMSFY